MERECLLAILIALIRESRFSPPAGGRYGDGRHKLWSLRRAVGDAEHEGERLHLRVPNDNALAFSRSNSIGLP
jgi:hypothetical protein